MGKRFAEVIAQGQVPLVLQLVDHDPTGLDMSRRLRAPRNVRPPEIEVQPAEAQPRSDRRPVTLFAKESDSRFEDYVLQFGTTDCWELAALDLPNAISGLVRAELESLIDRDAWASAIAAEDDNRAVLAAAASNWPLVKSALRSAP